MRIVIIAAIFLLFWQFPVSLSKKLKGPLDISDPEEVWMNGTLLSEIDQIIEEEIKQQRIPGAVVLVGRFGKIVKRKAFGLRAFDPINESMTEDTIFDLASVTKPVGTASMAMKLIEAKNLSLNDTVASIITNFSNHSKENVQIFHVLTHTTGLQAYADAQEVNRTYPELPSHDAVVEYIANLTQKKPEGTAYIYSCLNFLTQMRINENKTGKTGDAFLKENVFGPLQMKDTGWFLSEEQISRTAQTIRNQRGKVHDPLANFYLSSGTKTHCSGNAGLFSTVNDLSLYVRMLINEGKFNGTKIFEPETVNDLLLKRQLSPDNDEPRTYGWGISVSCPWSTKINHLDNFEIVYHTGYTGTYVWMDKASRAFFILLTNRVLMGDKGDASIAYKRTADKVLRSLDIYKQYFINNPKCENETFHS